MTLTPGRDADTRVSACLPRRVRSALCAAAILALAACAGPTALPPPGTLPGLRPTFPFPTGTPVPVTSAEGVLIETETGPLYVILSTVDEHGLRGQPLVEVASQPDPDNLAPAASVPSGSFAQVLEIRRLPPDYLRAFYLVRGQDVAGSPVEGWVSDWYARRTAFVVAFDEQGCACAFRVPLWSDPGLTELAGSVANRSPLRLLGVSERAVHVLVLSDGALGWLDRASVFESQDPEFLKYIRPTPQAR